MQAQRNFANFYLKNSTGDRAQWIRLMVAGIVLALAITAVVLSLAGHAHAVGTVLPHVTGHSHAARMIVEGPPNSAVSPTPTP